MQANITPSQEAGITAQSSTNNTSADADVHIDRGPATLSSIPASTQPAGPSHDPQSPLRVSSHIGSDTAAPKDILDQDETNGGVNINAMSRERKDSKDSTTSVLRKSNDDTSAVDTTSALNEPTFVSPNSPQSIHQSSAGPTISEWSHQHQHLPPLTHADASKADVDEWQDMPAYAPYDIYDDDGKLIAREADESDAEEAAYGGLGGAGKGYTRVQVDEDAQSATSLDDNTAYLFKNVHHSTQVDEEEESRDPLSQMQTTKTLLTDNQRIAYVGVVRLAMVDMLKELQDLDRTRGAKKDIDFAAEAMKMWAQKMMVRLYSHMELDAAEQIMIEQLAQHGLQPGDLTPVLMQHARVKNPITDTSDAHMSHLRPSLETDVSSKARPNGNPLQRLSIDSGNPMGSTSGLVQARQDKDTIERSESPELPSYQECLDLKSPNELASPVPPGSSDIDIDIRWTVLCDLFLVLISDSVYDSRSRSLLERVGTFLNIPWLDVCRFEKRITDALEMQESANKETWNEDAHMESRKNMAKRRRLILMGLATVGGGIVIGLSAGLLAPVIGAGIAAGFTTIGVTGTSGFLAGAGGAAIIGTGGVITGGSIGVRAANRRTGAVKTFEYRPLHNNKRVNLIISVAGWMNGKVDDVRLPFSTVNPIMGDIYSILWEPEMLQSMGATINILATEALTQGLQQILGATILVALMAALQLPIVLSKLAYLIDNPWSVSLARADLAGLILADSLIDRNLGARPITLVGFSLGSRVIFSALRELANKGALGLVQNVYLYGSPIIAKRDDYLRAKTVVSGRFVNGYATNDWILGYLFRATSGGIMRVAGLAQVEVPGIENVDVTSFVPGHMAYRKSMPRLLREVGWEIESDDFTEIEDPDPDNHEKRQRELINEIEEARKELERKPQKRRFAFFNSRKLAQKKNWETYDDQIKHGGEQGSSGTSNIESNDILFDVDALRREAVELAAQGIVIKQLESTLPPMRLDPSSTNVTTMDTPVRRPSSLLRETRSYDASSKPSPYSWQTAGSKSFEHQDHDNTEPPLAAENITMSFEDPSDNVPHARSSLSYPTPSQAQNSAEPSRASVENLQQPPMFSRRTKTEAAFEQHSDQPREDPARTSNLDLGNLNHNTIYSHSAWADEDDEEFGKEREQVEMTFA